MEFIKESSAKLPVPFNLIPTADSVIAALRKFKKIYKNGKQGGSCEKVDANVKLECADQKVRTIRLYKTQYIKF